MAITSRCTECGSESSGSGGIVHAASCSAVTLAPKLNYGQQAPAIELKFGSEAERKKFMKNIGGGSMGNQNYGTPAEHLQNLGNQVDVSDLAAMSHDSDTERANPPTPINTINSEVDELILKIGLHDQFDIDHKHPDYLKAKAIIEHKIAQEANKAQTELIRVRADLAYAAGKIEGLTGEPDKYLAKQYPELTKENKDRGDL